MTVPFDPTRGPQDRDPAKPRFRAVYVYSSLRSYLRPEDVYPDDWKATGVYEALVPADCSDGLAANVALAGFNMLVPIKRLYDFELTVRNPETGAIMEREVTEDYYEHADKCGGVRLIGHLG